MLPMSVKQEFKCANCGYGAVALEEPAWCPMCHESLWEFAPWRPFTATAVDVESQEPAESHELEPAGRV